MTTAMPIHYWTDHPTHWGTCVTTTQAIVRNDAAEEPATSGPEIVCVVSPGDAVRNESRYRLVTLSENLPRVFFFDGPAGSLSVKAFSQTLTSETEIDRRIWRGIFEVRPEKRMIFEQTLDLSSPSFRRWTPQIHIDRRTRDRDDV